MITDGRPEGRRVGRIRNLQAPLYGARKIAAFVATTARSSDLDAEIHELNVQSALVFYDEDTPFAALLLAVADDRIHRVFFHVVGAWVNGLRRCNQGFSELGRRLIGCIGASLSYSRVNVFKNSGMITLILRSTDLTCCSRRWARFLTAAVIPPENGTCQSS